MADNRINQALENIVNGEPFDNPRTDDEVMLSKIAAGEEVTENARNRFQYWLKQIEAGGGGNPNYVETVQTTLGGAVSALLTKISKTDLPSVDNLSCAVSCLLSVKDYQGASYIGNLLMSAILMSDSSGIYVHFVGCAELNVSGSIYNTDGDYLRCSDTIVTGGKVFGSTYSSSYESVPCTLTIIHHPLPSGT